MLKPVSHLLRNARFALAVGPKRIARRAAIQLKQRCLRQRRLPQPSGWAVKSTLPLPLFPPKKGMTRQDEGLSVMFLNCAMRIDGEIDWSLTPRTRSRVLWLMNLHYMEYLEELDDRIFCRIVQQWLDVVADEPVGRFPEAWNPYTVSLRAVTWMRQLAVRKDLPAEFIERMVASIAAQLQFLVRNLETDVGGNHLVKNLKALIWGSSFFEGPLSDDWRCTALALLRREVERQLLPDGIHYERSISYHCQVFADLLEVRHLIGSDIVPGLTSWLESAAQAIADLSHPDGTVSLFGDSGLTMATSPADCLRAYEIVFGKHPHPRECFSYQHGGYHGVRSRDHYFVIDCGAICPADLPAHGHGDILSYELSLRGQRVVVDQGVFEYVEGAMRDRSRSSRYHNTLSVDGGDQAHFFGAFRSVAQARAELLEFSPQPNGVVFEGRHCGFAMSRLGPSPQHVRRIEVRAGGLRVRDKIERRGWTGNAYSSLLLAPAMQVERVAADELFMGNGSVRCRLKGSLPMEIAEANWWPDMGSDCRTCRIVFTLPVSVDTLEYFIEVL